ARHHGNHRGRCRRGGEPGGTAGPDDERRDREVGPSDDDLRHPIDTDLTRLILVTGTCLAVLGWAGRKRFPVRIGVGNFFRRKTQVAIVVAGLLIGTAIITSSFVIQTTFDSTIRSAVIRALDFVDETIFIASPSGSRLPFNVSVYDDLAATLSTMPDVSTIAPRIQMNGAVIDRSSRLFD